MDQHFNKHELVIVLQVHDECSLDEHLSKYGLEAQRTARWAGNLFPSATSTMSVNLSNQHEMCMFVITKPKESVFPVNHNRKPALSSHHVHLGEGLYWVVRLDRLAELPGNVFVCVFRCCFVVVISERLCWMV